MKKGKNKKIVINRQNSPKVKHKYQFIVRLNIIKYSIDFFCYLSFYINLTFKFFVT